ncbi:MAG: sterol desaturase family protein, partial [Actinomycetota bacterium]|nr:sterol desaturase family protein [Actinomycetota bacterium]
MNFFVSAAVVSSLYLVVAALEQVPALRFRPLRFLRPHLATDVAWYGLAVTNSVISVFVLQPQLSKLAVGPISRTVGQLPAAVRLLLALLVFDFVAFAVHVGVHRSNILWNVHKVHHSSLQLDWLAATRAHMFENLIRFVAAQMVLFLVGVPVGQVAVVTAVFAAFGLLDHSNLGVNLRWAEAVFVTPRLHRRHHVPETSQKNFGAVFSLWDRLFGTLVQYDT